MLGWASGWTKPGLEPVGELSAKGLCNPMSMARPAAPTPAPESPSTGDEAPDAACVLRGEH